MPDEAEVQILINAKNMAGPAMEEARAFAKNLQEAIQSLNRATADGAAVNEAAKQALNAYSRGLLESTLTAKEQKDAIQDMRQALTRYIEVVAAGMAPQDAEAAVFALQTEAIRRNTDATQDNIRTKLRATAIAGAAAIGTAPFAVGAGLAGVINPFGGPGGFLGTIGAAAVALEPFVALVTAAIVVMASFTAGAAAMAAVLGAISLGFLGLGAGLVLLADKTGQLARPMAQFKADFTDMVDKFGHLAAPAATGILKFVEGLMPLAQREGAGIIEWFNARLPNALTSVHAAINNLLPDLNGFGRFLGQVFDHVSPQIPAMFQAIAQLGISALEGLISNLVALSDWFQNRLPTYGPIVKQIFGAIGDAVQGAGNAFGKLSDWFAHHWPQITKDAEQAKDAFIKGWNAIPSFGGPASADPAQIVSEILTILGIVSHIVVDVVDAIIVITQQAAAALPAALFNIQVAIAQFINSVIDIADHIPGVNISHVDVPQVTHPTSSARNAGRGHGITQVNNFYNTKDPQATARAVARQLGKVATF